MEEYTYYIDEDGNVLAKSHGLLPAEKLQKGADVSIEDYPDIHYVIKEWETSEATQGTSLRVFLEEKT